MNVEIAQKLVELRKKSGYSQEELAWKLGLSRQAISKWERAESSPDTDNLIALAKLYAISLDTLLAISPTDSDDLVFAIKDRADGAAVGSHLNLSPGSNQNSNAGTNLSTGLNTDLSASQGQNSNAGADASSGSDQATVQTQAQQTESWPNWSGDCYPNKNEDPSRKKSSLRYFPYPLVTVILYLAIGYFFQCWHPAWLIFLTTPLYYWAVKLREERLNRTGR